MSLLGLFAKNPTKDWREHTAQELTLDLKNRTINGIALDASAEMLKQLGRPSNKNAWRRGSFNYPASGLEVGVNDGQICGVHVIVVADEFSKGFSGADLTIIGPEGESIRVREGATREEVIEALSIKPDDKDVFEDHIVDMYDLGDYDIELVSRDDGQVKELTFSGCVDSDDEADSHG